MNRAALKTLRDIISAELDRPVPPEAAAVAEALRRSDTGRAILAILFYGSCRRRPSADGVLDFYVIVDRYRSWKDGPAAAAERVLPPTVYHHRIAWGEGSLRAKVAFISRRDFTQRVAVASPESSVWARFCQPVGLAFADGAGARAWVEDMLVTAVVTAVRWAVWLGPPEGTPADYWTGLFRHTYEAELRAEGGGRAEHVYRHDAARYDNALMAVLSASCAESVVGERDRLKPIVDPAPRFWGWRRSVTKTFSVLRLVKSATTFDNGVDYIIWKIGRHTGEPVRLTPWQRRHPILAAPRVLWSLYRRGMIR